ncbi:hypothetical protein HDU93_007734 [Gonapodya sp. JEL0774]|nr:hypothetical protein HDU93_007734 [Gonapodya sp. JEL0774]
MSFSAMNGSTLAGAAPPGYGHVTGPSRGSSDGTGGAFRLLLVVTKVTPASSSELDAQPVTSRSGSGLDFLMNAVDLDRSGGYSSAPGVRKTSDAQAGQDLEVGSQMGMGMEDAPVPPSVPLAKKPRRPKADLLLLDDVHRMGAFSSATLGSRRSGSGGWGSGKSGGDYRIEDEDWEQPGTVSSGGYGVGGQGGASGYVNPSGVKKQSGGKRRRVGGGSLWAESGEDEDGLGEEIYHRRNISHSKARGVTPTYSASASSTSSGTWQGFAGSTPNGAQISSDVAWVYAPGSSQPPPAATLPQTVVESLGEFGEGVVVVPVDGQQGCPICGDVGVDEWVGCDGCEKWYHFG